MVNLYELMYRSVCHSCMQGSAVNHSDADKHLRLEDRSHMFTHTPWYTHEHSLTQPILTHTHTQTKTLIHLYIHTHPYTHKHARTHKYVYMFSHTHARTHTHTYTHSLTHTYTHMTLTY